MTWFGRLPKNYIGSLATVPAGVLFLILSCNLTNLLAVACAKFTGTLFSPSDEKLELEAAMRYAEG